MIIGWRSFLLNKTTQKVAHELLLKNKKASLF